MGNFVSSDVVIESDAITGVIDSKLILDHLTLSDPSVRESLVHIKGGTKVFNVNRILQGLDPVSVEEEGKRSDDKDPANDYVEDRQPVEGLVNINTAPWKVLASLPMVLNNDGRLRHGNSPDWPGRAGVVD